MNIGFFHFYGLGDNIITFDLLYTIKKIWEKDRLIVFGNSLFENLLKYCTFVDEFCNIGNDIKSNISLINKYNLDYALLTNCKRCYLYPLQESNAKIIITETKIASLFSMRCKTIPLHILPKYRKMDGRNKCMQFAKKINNSLFESNISSIDFRNAKIQTSDKYKEEISHFLLDKLGYGCNHYLILINPFSYTASHSLSIYSFLRLIQLVGDMGACIPIVVTYPDVKDKFIKDLLEFRRHNKIHNLIVFDNGNDILKLAELVSRVSCVISPSTGTIHLASNMFVPTIGLYSQLDIIKWATRDRCHILIKKPLHKISIQEEETIVQETINMLKMRIQNNDIRMHCNEKVSRN